MLEASPGKWKYELVFTLCERAGFERDVETGRGQREALTVSAY